MCAHIGQKQHIYPPSIFRLHFWLDTPSPYSAGWRWGLLSRKIFLFFLIRYRTRIDCYFDFRFILVWLRFGIYFISLRIIASIRFLDLISRFYISTRFYSLNITRINFDLFQHCWFYALTLQLFISLTFLLVINKHLCLYEFVLCLF